MLESKMFAMYNGSAIMTFEKLGKDDKICRHKKYKYTPRNLEIQKFTYDKFRHFHPILGFTSYCTANSIYKIECDKAY